MEITLEAIISLIGLLVGGGSIGGFLFWRQTKRKAKAEAALAEAEAKLKEAEAKQAEVVAVNSMQEAYEKMFENVKMYLDDAAGKVNGMRKERDYYKQRFEEVQEKFDKFNRNVMEWKRLTDDTIDDLKRNVAKNGRQISVMRPFMCGDLSCKRRQRVVLSEDAEVKVKKSGKKDNAAKTQHECTEDVAADATGVVAEVEPLKQDEL